MPETIISQFQRAYNSPIETRRQVNTSTDRDNIPSSVRWRGMLVHVISDDVTYELVGGIDNGSWQPLTGLQDAPSDGETYGRKDGAWEIISAPIQNPLIQVKSTDSGNPAGQSITLFSASIDPGDLSVGDVVIMSAWGNCGTSDSDDNVNFRFGSQSDGVFNLPMGNWKFDVVYNVTATGVSGSARISWMLTEDNGDFILSGISDYISEDLSSGMLVGVIAGGTSVNSVVVKSGTIFHYKTPF